jgi:acetyltransferase-like isoleucine patch superfamily enzyme
MSNIGPLAAMKEQFSSKGLVWGAFATARMALGMLRWKVLALYLRAPGLNLGSDCELSGLRFVQFGRDVRARGGLWIEAVSGYQGDVFTPSIVIGDRVRFSRGVHIAALGTVRLGNDVLFGSNVLVSDHNHGAYAGAAQTNPDQPPVSRPLRSPGAVLIEDNVWIGDNAVILAPAHIGFGAVIGANSVVRGDVPAGSLAAGAPSRVLKLYDRAQGLWVSTASKP